MHISCMDLPLYVRDRGMKANFMSLQTRPFTPEQFTRDVIREVSITKPLNNEPGMNSVSRLHVSGCANGISCAVNDAYTYASPQCARRLCASCCCSRGLTKECGPCYGRIVYVAKALAGKRKRKVPYQPSRPGGLLPSIAPRNGRGDVDYGGADIDYGMDLGAQDMGVDTGVDIDTGTSMLSLPALASGPSLVVPPDMVGTVGSAPAPAGVLGAQDFSGGMTLEEAALHWVPPTVSSMAMAMSGRAAFLFSFRCARFRVAALTVPGWCGPDTTEILLPDGLRGLMMAHVAPKAQYIVVVIAADDGAGNPVVAADVCLHENALVLCTCSQMDSAALYERLRHMESVTGGVDQLQTFLRGGSLTASGGACLHGQLVTCDSYPHAGQAACMLGQGRGDHDDDDEHDAGAVFALHGAVKYPSGREWQSPRYIYISCPDRGLRGLVDAAVVTKPPAGGTLRCMRCPGR